MNTERDTLRKSRGVARRIFVLGLVAVAAVASVTSYFVAGALIPRQQSITLIGAGATFPYPLLSSISVEYTRVSPFSHINYQSIGSGGGIKALTAKTVDFAASDAPLTDAQRSNATNSLHIPATIGSVVLAYNLQDTSGATVPKGLNITGSIIADIFLGTITKWNDPAIASINPGFQFPDQSIVVVHRSEGSGTTFVWTSYLSIVSSTWSSQVGKGTSVPWPIGLGEPGNEGVAGTIRTTPYSTGYVELAYALKNSMAYASIKNKAGNYIEPTLASTQASLNTVGTLPNGDQSWSSVTLLDSSDPQAYPIASFSYLLVYKELNVVPGMTLEKAKVLVAYLWFVIHYGQSIAPSLEYVPLPSSVISVDETTVESITFNGQNMLS